MAIAKRKTNKSLDEGLTGPFSAHIEDMPSQSESESAASEDELSDYEEEEFPAIEDSSEDDTPAFDSEEEDISSVYDSDDSATSLNALIKKNTEKPDDNIGNQDAGFRKPLSSLEKNAVLVRSHATGQHDLVKYPEIEADYNSDSSTEDDPLRIGNVPRHWYDDMPHLGYDVNGHRVLKPANSADALDKFLEAVEGDGTTVPDLSTGKEVQLTEEELDIIKRLQQSAVPDSSFDPYAYIDISSVEPMQMPMSARPEPKSRFVKSKWEHQKIMKIVRAIRAGKILPRAPAAASKPPVYALWDDQTDQPRQDHIMHIATPSMAPPTHAESYNPPAEYLPSKEESEEWKATEKEDRGRDYLPAKYDALRKVPAYPSFVQERFDRCLDLYLAPRVRKKKLDIDPESLVPKLPAPQDLRPFPISNTIHYHHHTRVRCISVDPTGTFIATGSEDGIVRLWELAIGRCATSWTIGSKSEPVQALKWNPNKAYSLLAASTSNSIHLLSPLTLISPKLANASSDIIAAAFDNPVAGVTLGSLSEVDWSRPSEEQRSTGLLCIIRVVGLVKQLSWHRKGDYMSSVAPDAVSKSILIHQISRHHTQNPFKRTKGAVQKVSFHPTEPHFFVVTQRYVRLYDLSAQKLLKTLQPGLKWLSCVDIHPGGSNLLVGSYDRKLSWFDLDLGEKPYRTLRYHSKAIRSAVFHPSLPLFASASDDGNIHVFHSSVSQDYSTNALIVPLKVLRGHAIKDDLGVLDLAWHQTLPWLFSAGADGRVLLWSD